jgi:hypothetical protein
MLPQHHGAMYKFSCLDNKQVPCLLVRTQDVYKNADIKNVVKFDKIEKQNTSWHTKNKSIMFNSCALFRYDPTRNSAVGLYGLAHRFLENTIMLNKNLGRSVT